MCKIESETGRVEVYLYGEAFSKLRPKERIWESSLADRVMELASDVSFSKATKYINEFLHRNDSDSLRLKTVEEFVERMGSKIAASYKSASDAFLSETGIDTEKGIVSEGSAIPDGATNPNLPELADSKRVSDIAERYNLGHKGREAIDAGRITIPIEQSADDCVYVYVDGILVKHQKECRKPDCKRSSKFLENNVACIQYGKHKYSITDTDMREVFRRIMAVLLTCNLLVDKRLIFITDGATIIKEYIQEFFGFRQYTLILDWYHLEHKCYQMLSSALKCGKKVKEEKDRTINTLQSILWAGNVKAALEYIAGIDQKLVKSQQAIDSLVGYITRKQENIPCYALRKGLGLHNSSNPVEKENDLLIAQRQKGRGMAWSVDGSAALAAITVAGQNKERADILMGMKPNYAYFS